MYKWMISITFALLLSQAAAAGNCSLQATESRLQNKDPQVLMEVERVRQRNAPSASEARVMKWGNERKTHA